MPLTNLGPLSEAQWAIAIEAQRQALANEQRIRRAEEQRRWAESYYNFKIKVKTPLVVIAEDDGAEELSDAI